MYCSKKQWGDLSKYMYTLYPLAVQHLFIFITREACFSLSRNRTNNHVTFYTDPCFSKYFWVFLLGVLKIYCVMIELLYITCRWFLALQLKYFLRWFGYHVLSTLAYFLPMIFKLFCFPNFYSRNVPSALN